MHSHLAFEDFQTWEVTENSPWSEALHSGSLTLQPLLSVTGLYCPLLVPVIKRTFLKTNMGLRSFEENLRLSTCLVII